MQGFTYVEVAHRDEGTYRKIRWDDGERPDWWREHFKDGLEGSSVWLFAGPRERFATFDLEEVCERLSDLREDLFLSVPLRIGEQAQIETRALHVERLELSTFIRHEWKRLERLRSEVNTTAAVVDALLLRVGEELAERNALPLLFEFPNDWNFGVTPTYMRTMSAGSDFYELRNALAAYEDEIQEDRARERAMEADQREARRRERELKAGERQQREAIRTLIGYLSQPDFEPRNEAEAEAHELHRRYEAATTSSEKYDLMNQLKDLITDKGIA